MALWKYLFSIRPLYTPFFSTALSAILLWSTAWILFLEFDKVSSAKYPKLSSLIFVTAYISFPTIIAGYITFSTINTEYSLANLLCTLSVIFLFDFLYHSKKFSRFLFSVLLLFTSLSFYQSFTIVFVEEVIGLSLWYFIFSTSHPIKGLFRTFIISVSVFITALVSYFCANKILMLWIQKTLSPYLNTFIPSQISSISSIQSLVFRYYEKDSFTALLYLLLIVLFLLSTLKYLRPAKTVLLLLPLVALFILTPFAPIFVLGRYMPYRTLWAHLYFAPYALFFFFITFYAVHFKIARYAAFITALIIVFFQIQYINEIFYRNHMNYEEDKRLATILLSEIYKVPDHQNLEFLPIGQRDNSHAPIRFDTIGYSFFDGNIRRTTDFLHACGFHLKKYTGGLSRTQILEICNKMSKWPSDGSIHVIDNRYLVVQFSEPTDYWCERNQIRN